MIFKKNRLFKNLFIFPSFQRRLVYFNLFIFLLNGMLIFAFIKLAFSHLYQQGTDINLANSHPYFKFLSLQEMTIVRYVTISIILCLFINVFGNLFLSHRLTGPIYRLKTFFRKVAQSRKIEKLSFRKGDFISDMSTDINNVLDRIKED